MNIKQIQSMSQIDPSAWNQLAGTDYPFIRHEFLTALEESGSVCNQTGWKPAHLLVYDDEILIALMPLYLKGHSWGEYIFDHQWAQAFQQHGLNYYPKWLTAIPLTPCQGSRIVVRDEIDPFKITQLLLSFIKKLSKEQNISSWHCLFPTLPQVELLESLQLSIREGVQFQWFNKDYLDFDDYLLALSSSKRKMIKRERKRVIEQGIELLRIAGTEITPKQWKIFFNFYSMTYLKKGSEPYLNLAFFEQIAATMGEQLLLVFAIKDDNPVAAALSFVGVDTLYGRYWGCYDEYHSLHFETCYYQGLDYCIQNGLKRFDSGAQGEHKIARGFEPITTYSAHWIQDSQFAKAVDHFVIEERKSIEYYKMNANSYLPFKQTD